MIWVKQRLVWLVNPITGHPSGARGAAGLGEVMRAAMARVAARRDGRRHVVPVPDVVMAATRQLIERESHARPPLPWTCEFSTMI